MLHIFCFEVDRAALEVNILKRSWSCGNGYGTVARDIAREYDKHLFLLIHFDEFISSDKVILPLINIYFCCVTGTAISKGCVGNKWHK